MSKHDQTSDFHAPIFGNPADYPDASEADAAEETTTETVEVAATPDVNSGSQKRDQKESKILLVDPACVHVVHEDNGRHEPATEDDIKELAASILKHGQLQAAMVRRYKPSEQKETGFTFRLIFGFTRHAAVSTIPGAKLKIALVEGGNSHDHFLMNLEENRRRNATNYVDDAYNMLRLKNTMGWKTDRIAEFYNCSQAKVSQIRRLTELEPPAQRKVASGMLSLADAMKFLKLDTESQAEVLASVPDVIPVAPIAEQPPETATEATETSPATNGEAIDSGHPTSPVPAKSKRGKKQTQEEINRKASKAYETSRKKQKQGLAKTLHQKAKEKLGQNTARLLPELKAALSGREDVCSKAIIEFLKGEMNAEDLNAELDRIEEVLTDHAEASKAEAIA